MGGEVREYLMFSENVQPSEEATEWLKKVNAALGAEFERQAIEMIVYGSTAQSEG